MTRHFIIDRPSYIGDTLVAASSRATDADLNGAEPGSAFIEVDASGKPLDPKDAERILNMGLSTAPIQVAPVAPHAPNPTHPQAVPGNPAGAAAIAGDRNYRPADGVESNESAQARVERLRRELEDATAALDAAGQAAEIEQPQRRGSTGGGAGGSGSQPDALDQSVPALKEHLATINDPAELARLRQAEVAGKSRSSALEAIDARFTELNA